MAAELQPGDRVRTQSDQLATVRQVGGCTHPPCPDPTQCVEVLEDRYSTTTNFQASYLTKEDNQ